MENLKSHNYYMAENLIIKPCAYCGKLFEGGPRKKYCQKNHQQYAGTKKWTIKNSVTVTPPKAEATN